MHPSSEVTGIVLAGGMSSRLGRNKALEPVGGRSLILRVLDRLSTVTDRAVAVVNDARRAAELGLPSWVRPVVDEYPGTGSLGGIYTGLANADTDWGVVVACDMPFLNTGLLTLMLSKRQGSDVVVPVLDGRPEPTHAAYSRVCLPHIRRRLEAGELKITGFFESVRVRYLDQPEVEALDPGLLSFFNVNTQTDLDGAHELVSIGH